MRKIVPILLKLNFTFKILWAVMGLYGYWCVLKITKLRSFNFIPKTGKGLPRTGYYFYSATFKFNIVEPRFSLSLLLSKKKLLENNEMSM